jgi:hypothetical protein
VRFRMPLGAALLVFGLVSPSSNAGANTMAAGGSCLVNVTATFSGGGVKLTPTTSTMSWSANSSLCGGTAVFTAASAEGNASPSAIMTCNSIAVSGSGSISYDGAGEQDFTWQFVGGTAGGALILLPIGDLVVGTIALASVNGLTNCEVPSPIGSNASFASQTSVSYLGVMTWAEVVNV